MILVSAGIEIREIIVVRSEAVRVSYHRQYGFACTCSLNQYVTYLQCAESSGKSNLPNITCCFVSRSLNGRNSHTLCLSLEVLLADHDGIARERNVNEAVTNNIDVCVCSRSSSLCHAVSLQNLECCARAVVASCKTKVVLDQVAGINLSRTLEWVNELATNRRMNEGILDKCLKTGEHVSGSTDLTFCLNDGRTVVQHTTSTHLFHVGNRSVVHNLFTFLKLLS
uniref:Uncharacterized protein n=1 Tax=Myoviridae sp. ctBoB21 TaxID=2827287 RepID=A0A8S5R5P0_9CAUD|nr:MAG TPA: hypothetical protein [Myoviridae sp. ctBoB21]